MLAAAVVVWNKLPPKPPPPPVPVKRITPSVIDGNKPYRRSAPRPDVDPFDVLNDGIRPGGVINRNEYIPPPRGY